MFHVNIGDEITVSFPFPVVLLGLSHGPARCSVASDFIACQPAAWSVKLKVVPFPSSLSTVMLPPCRVMISFEM